MRAPLGEELRHLVARVAALADGDLQSRRPRHLAERDVVFRLDRLLEPVDAGFGELMGEPARRPDAEASVAVDEHLNVGADRRAHRRDIVRCRAEGRRGRDRAPGPRTDRTSGRDSPRRRRRGRRRRRRQPASGSYQPLA